MAVSAGGAAVVDGGGDGHGHGPGGDPGAVIGGQRVPPVTQLGMASLALIVAGGIYLSAHIPQHVPLGPAIALLAGSVVLLMVNLLLLARVRAFPWARFVLVAKWSLLAYASIAGLIEYAFVRNHVRGGTLVVLTLSLVVFAVHVPVLIGFTVARFDGPEEGAAEGGLAEAAADGGLASGAAGAG